MTHWEIRYKMRQKSGEAVHGFIAFLRGEEMADNPHDKELPYKNWASGWRNAKEATQEEIDVFRQIYNH